MKNKILWIITVIPIIIAAFVFQFMPDRIPMHYDLSGNIDRWGSKYEIFLLPVMILFFTLFWKAFIKYFQRKTVNGKTEKEQKEAANNIQVLYYTAIGVAVLFNIINCVILYTGFTSSEGQQFSSLNLSLVTNIGMGFFIIAMGNILPKAGRNSVVGLRTVWSMDNDRTWAKSNRFAGKVFIVAGVLIILESCLLGGFASTMVLLAIIIVSGIVSVAYSYKVYKEDKIQNG